MSTPKTNGNGAKEVTPATNNKTNTNGKVTTSTGDNKPKTEEKPAAPIPPKAEEKVAPVVVEMPKIEAPKPKTLEEQINYFLGLEKLVNRMRRLETHLDAVQELVVADVELNKFENESSAGASIVLKDSHQNRYEINNPRLVKEMLTHLEGLIQSKIDEHNTQILTYGETETA